MKKQLGLKIASCAAVFAVCIFFSLVYNKIAIDGLIVDANALQRATLPVLAVILAVVACIRLVLPRFEAKAEDFENIEKPRESALTRCTDFAACLSLGLALAALVAAPLADTADYIGLAALFGVLFGVFALVPTVAKVGQSSGVSEKTAIALSASGIIISILPAVGIYSALCGAALSVTSMGNGILGKDKGTIALVMNILSLILSVIFSLLFVLI